MLLLVGTGVLLTGCAHLGGKDVRPIWKDRDQYVQVEKQDRQSGSVPVDSAHPANVSAERLSSILASLEVRIPNQKRAQPLFNPTGIRILSEKISQGLAAAAPGEDVTFAYVGTYPVLALMAVLKEDKVTTGRVFVRDGQVNIIFGKLHDKVNEKEDRRLNPFLPGSREMVMPQEWLLVEKPGGENFTRKRPDWLVFNLTPPAVLVTPTDEAEAEAEAPAAAVATPGVPAARRATPAAPVKKSVEERLTILKGLKDKGLITEEEFKAKRQDILNDL
jgi:hypothetical protein